MFSKLKLFKTKIKKKKKKEEEEEQLGQLF
jgi:hypothetical protein